MNLRDLPFLSLPLLVACSHGATGASSSSSAGGHGGGATTSTAAGGAGGTGGAGGQPPLLGATCADALDITAQVKAGLAVTLPAPSTMTPPASKCSTEPGAKLYFKFTVDKAAEYSFDSNSTAIVLRHQCDGGASITCFDWTGGKAVLKKGDYYAIADGVDPSQGLQITIAPDYYCNYQGDCSVDEGRPICDYSHVCVACMASSDCPKGQFCDTLQETCNGCSADADCASSIFGAKCSPTGTCGCATTADCSAATPVCAASGLCLACAPGLNDCDGDPNTGCESDPVVDGTNCGACGAGCAGGGCNGSACGPAPVVALAGANPRLFVLDGATAYYFDATTAAIMSMPLAGGSATTVVTASTGIDALAVDATRVYYSDGTGVASVLKAGGGAVQYTQDTHLSFTIASDGTNVFWGDATGGQIRSAPVAGGAVKTVASNGMSPVIALDATNVYAIDENGLQRIPKTGGVATQLWASQSNCHVLWIDGSFAYTADPGGLVAVPLGGGSPQPLFDLASRGFSCIDGIVGDAANLYLQGSTNTAYPQPERIFRLSKSGGAPTNLADGQFVLVNSFDPWTGNFGVDATSVYWIGGGPGLLKTPK